MRLLIVAALAATVAPAFAADNQAAQQPAIPDTTSAGADKCDASLSYCLAGVGPEGVIVFEETGDAKSKAGLGTHSGMLCNANTDGNAGGYVTETKAGVWGDRQNPTQLAAGKCVAITASALELHMVGANTPWDAVWVTTTTAAPAKVAVVHHPKKPKTAATTLPTTQPAQQQQPVQQLQPDSLFQPTLPQ